MSLAVRLNLWEWHFITLYSDLWIFQNRVTSFYFGFALQRRSGLVYLSLKILSFLRKTQCFRIKRWWAYLTPVLHTIALLIVHISCTVKVLCSCFLLRGILLNICKNCKIPIIRSTVKPVPDKKPLLTTEMSWRKKEI